MSLLIIELTGLTSGSVNPEVQFGAQALNLAADSELRFSGQLKLQGRLSTSDGLVYYLSGAVHYQPICTCRLCLKEFSRTKECELSSVFAFPAGLEDIDPQLLQVDEETPGGVYPLRNDAGEIDLVQCVREAIILDFPDLAKCSAGCKGLCEVCGVNLNGAGCKCDASISDERWSKLTKLKETDFFQ